ncbi:MAG: hypothetical protein KDE27_15140 [Planctomycetes bacterium]|nr:hypothetical protein [Planctomycetota bacterium]
MKFSFLVDGSRRLAFVVRTPDEQRSLPHTLVDGWNWFENVPDNAEIGFFCPDAPDEICWKDPAELATEPGFGAQLAWQDGVVVVVGTPAITADAWGRRSVWRPDEVDWAVAVR